MRKITAVASAILMTITSVQVAQSVDGMGYVDSPVGAHYSLDKCTTKTEMNCIESLGLVSANGTYVDANLTSYEGVNHSTDSLGNINYYGVSVWQADEVTIRLFASLESPNNILWKNSETDIQYGSALRFSFNVDEPLTTKIRIKARTSWLRPQSVQVKMKESEFLDQPIPGGHRWTIEGMGLPHSTYNYSQSIPFEDRSPIADEDGILFDAFIHHAGIDDRHGFWPPTCADQGYTVQTNNTNETGEPSWDVKDQTLQFGVRAPHFKTNGELNLGYFKFWTTDKFLNCKFPGNTLSKAAKLTIQILDENGIQAIGTTTVSHENGQIKVVATGFHFSSPRIIVRAANTTPLKVIKCTSKTKSKIVTGRNPKCPAGYKKAS